MGEGGREREETERKGDHYLWRLGSALNIQETGAVHSAFLGMAPMAMGSWRARSLDRVTVRIGGGQAQMQGAQRGRYTGNVMDWLSQLRDEYCVYLKRSFIDIWLCYHDLVV